MNQTTLRSIKSNSASISGNRSIDKLALVHKAYSDDPTNVAFQQYSLLQGKPPLNKRWLANVSASKQIKSADVMSINVLPSATKSDFDIIKQLLEAKTCHTILFDKCFDMHQASYLKDLARFSGTQLMFVQDKAALESSIVKSH